MAQKSANALEVLPYLEWYLRISSYKSNFWMAPHLSQRRSRAAALFSRQANPQCGPMLLVLLWLTPRLVLPLPL